jgi:ParB family chromosome partitioning protein
MKQNNKKLGKGMAALFGESAISANILTDMKEKQNSLATNQKVATNRVEISHTPLLIDIKKIKANKDQPRKIFKESDIIELSKSIKENGVIQPIIVRESEEAGVFEVIAGERRLRASRLAKLERVPVVVKKATNKDTLVMAIIENVQRADLNCVEEALAYFQLMEEFKLTQEEVAKKIGKERSTIANFLRILKLPRGVISLLQKEQISFGHAKVLASVKDADITKRLAESAAMEKWSVRELEKAIRARKKTAVEGKPNQFFDERIDFIKNKLEKKTGFHFDIKSKSNGAGNMVIKFNNEAEFNDVFEFLMK